MSNNTLGGLLSIKKQMGFIELIANGLPSNNMPQELMTATEEFDGNSGTYFTVKGQRRALRNVAYGAPPAQTSQEYMGEEQVTLLSPSESKSLNFTDLGLLIAGDSSNVERVRRKLEHERRNFLELGVNFRIATVQGLISTGQLNFDADGNLLPDSTGADLTIDFGVPATNKGDVDGIISTSWADPTADILAQMEQIQNKVLFETGFDISQGTVLYGSNIPQYLAQNDSFKYTLPATANSSSMLQNNEVMSQMTGFANWQKFSTAYYERNDGANAGSTHQWCGPDEIKIIPPVSEGWWGVGEGTMPINTEQAITTIDDYDRAIVNNRGMYAYASIRSGKANVDWVQGDVFMPLLKNGGVVIQADVTP